MQNRRGGCFGLFAIIDSKRMILPLKGVECDFVVLSGMTEVCMTQVFRQENERALDCEYLFPLPADASVYECEADINGKIIRAQVREREEARQLAAEKKAAGFRTALVESERENLFTLSLGNVQPGDLVIIRLRYFQTLRTLARTRAVEIPFCPGMRYIPGQPLLRSNRGRGVVDDTNQVPDASRITPVRIDANHPDAAYVAVRGRWEGRFIEEKSLCSPSHRIEIEREGQDVLVTLSHNGEVPDRDFVVRWSERDAESIASRVWTRQKSGQTYALMEIRAPRKAPVNRSPLDFYFLVDRSGSMAGAKWDKAAEALQSCMKVLGPQDRAMVTFFESNFRDFAEEPLPPGQLLQDPRFQSLNRLGTEGGTEMEPALKHVLKVASRYSRERHKNLILITDAQIGNESEILNLMKTVPDLAVHAFGIDVALNDALLVALCRQQGGTFHSMNPNDDIQGAVTSLGQTLGQPVLLNLEIPTGWEIADSRIPNLYAGQIHYVSARAKNGSTLKLTARTPASEQVQIDFEQQSAAMEAPYLHWCRSRIDRLIAEGDDRKAIALSTESNLICRLTAFIAWDESEKVTVASHCLQQPCLDVSFSAPHAAILPDMLFCTMPRSSMGGSKRMRANLFRALLGSDKGQAPAPRRLKALEASDLEPELADLCRRMGGFAWEEILKAIHDQLKAARGPERTRGLEALRLVIEEIKDLVLQIEAWKRELAQQRQPGTELAQQLEERIAESTEKVRQLLRDFLEALPGWLHEW
jgi:Ca-activated chloride channel family protein